MSRFAVHTPETAPEASRFALAGAQSKFGFVPNLIGMLADSPAAVGGYLGIGEQFDRSSFTPAERQVVLLAVSFENGCDYCMAAHTVVAGMSKVPALAIEALRTGEPLPDPRLEALARFTRTVVRERGRVLEPDLAAFLAAGFTHAQVLEVVLGVAMKTLSNYANHLARTPLDPAFASARWEPAQLEPVG
ncbi:MAG: carboxymuconolactone decarboxylase family protein [Thermoanaerobaculia bacterium]